MKAFLTRYAGPLRVVLLVAIVAFAIYAVATSWDEVSTSLVEMGPLRIAGSSLVLAVSIAAHCASWLAVLRALGAPRLPFGASAAIWSTSQVAKYMPGSVWTAVVQADLGRRHGVQSRIMFASYGLALLVSLAVGSILSLLVFAGSVPFWVGLLAAAAAVCGVVLLGSLFVPRLLHSFLDKVFRRFSGEGMPPHIGHRALAWSIVFSVVAWFLSGWQSWILAEAIGATAGDFLFLVGAIVLSWVVGLVIIILPAGAGARELILVLTIGGVVGAPQALTIAIVTRFLQLIVELLLALIFGLPYAGTILRERRRRPAPTAPRQEDGS